MGLLDRIFNDEPRAVSPLPSPWDDVWYEPFGSLSVAGIAIDEGAAYRVSAVFNAVRMISESVAGFPFILYRRLLGGGKERAFDEPLYEILHDRPNNWQTPAEFREFLQGCALLRGHGYAEIISGRRGFVDQLIPLDPTLVEEEHIPGHRLRYQVRQPDGTKRTITQDRMFHLRGFRGLSVLSLMRETVGLSLATESHGARVFSQRANHAGILEMENKLDDDAYKRIKSQLDARTTGLQNAHSTLILENGLTWKQVGMSNEDAQFLLTRTFQIQEIARWFNIQPHKLADLTKSSFNNIEEENLSYVTDTVGPWNIRWAQTTSRDLIMKRELFAELLVDALLRGRTKERYEAHALAVRSGWRSPNEIRVIENQNKEEGLDYFVDVRQEHAGPGATSPGDSSPSTPPPPQRSARAVKIVTDAAARMVRKEIAQLEKRAERYAKDSAKWKASVERFYKEHALTLLDVLHLDKQAADAYCDRQKSDALEHGLTALNTWNETKPRELIDLALQEEVT